MAPSPQVRDCWLRGRTGWVPDRRGITQSATKTMIETTGMNSAAEMMPGLPMSCSRLTVSAMFDQIDTTSTMAKSSAQR